MKNTIQNRIIKLGLAIIAIFIMVTTWAQQNITVTVIDEGGKPFPCVSIIFQGTSTGTVTNIDGNFSLTVPADATLLFSFVGMKSISEPVKGKTTIF